jgi:hypothetical protein
MFEANVVLMVGGEDYQLMKQCLVIGSPVSLQQYSRCLFTINCLNSSVIVWHSVLLLEETGVPGEKQ